MEIERVPVDRINPAPYNPRKRLRAGDPAYEAISRSLDAFGLVEPLVWNRRTGNLVGGHQRLQVLRDQGAREVQVSVVDLDQEDERLLNLALNRVDGEWDEQMLAMVLRDLRDGGRDVAVSGFGEDEIDQLVAQLDADPEPSFSDAQKSEDASGARMLVSFLLSPEEYQGKLAAIEQAAELLGASPRIQEIEA